jgi:hypothetical protein
MLDEIGSFVLRLEENPVLYRGLISGYTAVDAAFVGTMDVDNGWRRADIAADFGFLRLRNDALYCDESRQFT